MIVVGVDSNGAKAALRFAFEEAKFGSVGQQVAHHAACPVAIVPHGRDDPVQ